jgi:acetyl esterase/lipase
MDGAMSWDITVERDLIFAPGLAVDIYRPNTQDTPVVLYLHGGGWSLGDKAGDGDQRLAPLARHGVTVVSADYNLVPDALFPRPLHDVKGAVRWLRANGPRLGLATERVGIWGASAGAYLGSLLALTGGVPEFEGTAGGHSDQSSAVQAVVHWFGPSDLTVAASRSELEARLLPFAFEAALLGATDATEVADRARGLSLPALATADAPPFLIAHGDRDRIIPPSEGFALHQALSRAGARSRFELLAGAGHEDAEFDTPANLATTAAWLRAVLIS